MDYLALKQRKDLSRVVHTFNEWKNLDKKIYMVLLLTEQSEHLILFKVKNMAVKG